MSSLTWANKDPNEVLDYVLDWSDRLSSETITASTWIVPATITKDSDARTGTTTTIWLSGGVVGERLKITNRVVTSAGRTFDQSVSLKIVEK